VNEEGDWQFRYRLPKPLPEGAQVFTIEEAERELNRQLEQTDKDPLTVLWELARLYNATGRQAQALQCLRRALAGESDLEAKARCVLALGQTMERTGTASRCGVMLHHSHPEMRERPAGRGTSAPFVGGAPGVEGGVRRSTGPLRAGNSLCRGDGQARHRPDPKCKQSSRRTPCSPPGITRLQQHARGESKLQRAPAGL
jgi:hypothetical protein